MGKKLDALLGRGFKTSKFKAMVALAISRLEVFKKQRHARCSIARSDVVEFLKNSNHDRALLRVEQVIKEQNLLDVFVLLEGYCNLLQERVNLIEHEKVCPEELQEAVSTLIYAATRCGEFPELQEIRAIFTSRFGREFAARAAELRNNCGVNPKIIQKLSTRMPSLENKMKVLRDIAAENNIDIPIEETLSDTKLDSSKDEKQKPGPSGVSDEGENEEMESDETERAEDFSDSFNMRRKYKDVAEAAQQAFKSAAYAAAAARAAVELSRSESTDPDDPTSPNLRPRKVSAMINPMKSDLQIHEKDTALALDSSKAKALAHTVEDEEMKYDKIHPVQNYGMETKDESSHVEKENEFKRSFSASSSDSLNENVKGVRVYDEERQIKKKGILFDESDEENDIAESSSRTQTVEPLNINRRPISVRTRVAHVR